MSTSTPLSFSVTRRPPELVPPAKPTPHGLMPLSDIDDQDALRFHMPIVHVYRNPLPDPIDVIRKALSEALVFYYPLAGRLREAPGRKLVVDCTGEGVMLVAADADVSLSEFREEDLFPPFPCWRDLLFDVDGTSAVVHSALLLFQVTRLLCGGVIVAVRLNHAISDAAGLLQFINATAEIARGASQPLIRPVWGREVLRARVPPRVTRTHREYEALAVATTPSVAVDELRCRSFFFGPGVVSSLRRLVSSHFRGGYSTFDLLTASLWRCRTIALQLNPHDEVRAVFTVNVRSRMTLVPAGYYGNTFGYAAAVSTAKNIADNPIGYALTLVKEAKATITEEHMRSVVDLMVIQGRPGVTAVQPQCYLVSDSRAGFDKVDFGWGLPVYGGPSNARVSSFLMSYVNSKGESGIVATVCLPPDALQRFSIVLDDLLKEADDGQQAPVVRTKIPNSSL